MSEKTCTKCGILKEISLFSKNKRTSSGYCTWCKSCDRQAGREYDIKTVYGLTLEEYSSLLIKQDNKCAICRQEENSSVNGRIRDLAVDHCHVTGRVRGLLCSSCNTALGKFKDNPMIVQSALVYLGNSIVQETILQEVVESGS